MKIAFAFLPLITASAVSAHESFAPHAHPHPISMLPDVETFGVAALVLVLGVIAFTYLKRG